MINHRDRCITLHSDITMKSDTSITVINHAMSLTVLYQKFIVFMLSGYFLFNFYGTMGGKTKDQGQKLQNNFNSGSENN
jgi:hypothetical protein